MKCRYAPCQNKAAEGTLWCSLKCNRLDLASIGVSCTDNSRQQYERWGKYGQIQKEEKSDTGNRKNGDSGGGGNHHSKK